MMWWLARHPPHRLHRRQASRRRLYRRQASRHRLYRHKTPRHRVWLHREWVVLVGRGCIRRGWRGCRADRALLAGQGWRLRLAAALLWLRRVGRG